MNRSQRGRRNARSRGVDAALVLSGVLPLAVAGMLALTHPEPPRIVTAAPDRTEVTSAEVTCPSPLTQGRTGEATLTLGSAAKAGTQGTFTVQAAPSAPTDGASTTEQGERVRVSVGTVADRQAGREATVIRGAGAVAPGMLAAVTTSRALSIWQCTEPRGEQWFAGVGAGPTQASVVELVNPNRGPAVADIEVFSDEGLLSVPALQGVAVPASSATRIDLGAVVPRAGTMALHVRVVRGQLGVSVRDRGERLSGGTSVEEWLAPQGEPATGSLLLGVQPVSGRHTLTVVNPGDSETTATVRLVTPTASFAPDGVKPLTVPAQSVVTLVLDSVLRSTVAEDVVGIEVEAGTPVATSLRSVVDGDLSFVGPAPAIASATAALLPGGSRTLVLGGASAVGVAVVVSRDGTGDEVSRERVALTPGRAATVRLPARARSVDVTPERTSLHGAVVATGAGAAVVQLRELQRTGAVPRITYGP